LRHFRPSDHRLLRGGRPGARRAPRRRIQEPRAFRSPHPRGLTLAFVTDPPLSSRQARRSSLIVLAAVLVASGAVGFLSYHFLVRPETGTLRKAAPSAASPVAAASDAEPAEAAPAS